MAEIVQLVGIIITILGAFFVLYVRQDRQKERIHVLESSNNMVEEKLTSIESTLDKVILRLDLFLKTEREEFREIVRQNTQALKDLAK